jgi:DNA helicase-2/ATP-dependent DNA helicase PcrA
MEWDVVHLIHLADGNLPSDLATGDDEGVEEERRLLYVAMTRARDALWCYVPLRYHHHRRGRDDAHGYAQRSRFLSRSVCSHFDHEGAGPVPPVDPRVGSSPPGSAPPTALAGVDDLLAALWR